MNNDDVKKLDNKNSQSLKDVYKKRLEHIKNMLLQAVLRGEDTSFLNKLKQRIEKEIQNLTKEFEKATDEIISSSQKTAFNNQQKSFEYIKFPILASVVLDKNTTKELKTTTNQSLKTITKNIDKKLKVFLNNDFSNKENIIKKFERLTDIKIPPSRIEPEYWKSLQNIIERDLKKKDIFKVAYKNKAGDVVRQVDVETYSEMLARTISANSYREEVKNIVLQQFKDVGDLVEVVGSAECKCDTCSEYLGKILSLTGKTKGFETIDEAKEKGLFHPNCVHYYTVTENVIKVYDKLSLLESKENDYTGKTGQDAINYLLEKKNGFIENAFTREDIGPISLIWGNDDMGLCHILKRRSQQKIDTDEFISNLSNVIEKGELIRINDRGRYEIFLDGKMAIIEPKTTNGIKTYLLTAFKRRKP